MKANMLFMEMLAGACIFFLAILALNTSVGKEAPVRAKTVNSALVIKDATCAMLDGDGKPQYITENTPDFHAVITKDNGNIMATCKGKVTPSSTQKGAIRWNFENTGYPCALGGYEPKYSKNWSEVVTPSGNATLKCTYHPRQGE